MAALAAAALAAAAGVLLAVHSFQPAAPSNADLVDVRLNTYEGVQAAGLDDLELQKPLSERALLPLLHSLSGVLTNSAPRKQILETQHRLELAGRPGGLSAIDFLALRYVAAAALALAGLGLGLATGKGIVAALLLCSGAVAGLVGPGMWLRSRVRSRQEEIQLALPDALDLLIVSVEAGLTLDAAMARVADKFHNALGSEMGRVLQEVRLGRPFLEALEDLGRRCAVDELQSFVQAVIQSQQLGAGIARILRLQADEIRRKRMQRAQEKGAQASIKMLLPMIGCIFPTIWIVLLGPALLIVIHVFRGR